MPHILKPKDPEVVVSLTLFILSLFSNDAFESYKVLPNFISSILGLLNPYSRFSKTRYCLDFSDFTGIESRLSVESLNHSSIFRSAASPLCSIFAPSFKTPRYVGIQEHKGASPSAEDFLRLTSLTCMAL